jgi:protein-L-isoaspartate(D-aspartate) O-methyltransferase
MSADRAAGPPKARPSFPARLVPSPIVVRAAVPSLRTSTSTDAQPVVVRQTSSESARWAMVRKLQAQGLSHVSVMQAMAAVERHRFVDEGLAYQAYEDTSLPIGLGQTISKPSVVARMLELLCADRTLPLGRVLEVGTGCGYQAAVLSALASEVYSIERLRGLHDKARQNLRFFRLPNVHLLLGDGSVGYAKGAPYAGILAAAGGEVVPQAWLDQLQVGGRLVAPVQSRDKQQHLVVVERTQQGYVSQTHEAVLFVPLKSGVA